MKCFLMQQASIFLPRYDILGHHISVKLDGHRIFWDGGLTRGMKKADVPWANTAKDSRYLDEQISTGLWSRYGNVVHAPDAWIDGLPKWQLLDGEVWCAGLSRQQIASIVKKLPVNRCYRDWAQLSFKVFDAPSLAQWMLPREIDIPNYSAKITQKDVAWATNLWQGPHRSISMPHYTAIKLLVQDYGIGSGVWDASLVYPGTVVTSNAMAEEYTAGIVEMGGEGAVVRHPHRAWEPVRSKFILKMKPREMDTATVTGVTEGKNGFVGMIGALICEDNGVTFEIGTGLDFSDRKQPADYWIGKTIKYTHRGYSDAGVPIETAYKGITED